MTNAIDQGIQTFSQMTSDIEILCVLVNQCTKDDVKQHIRVHPDSFFQLCIQLAYFKLHDYQPASTYETAPTRRFYRGRTETARTCTPEAIAWCRAMTNPSTVGEIEFVGEVCLEIVRMVNEENYFFLLRIDIWK